MATLLHIAAIMLPTMLACAWLLHAAGMRGSVPPRRLPPRKRPIDQGPETRLADRLPIKAARANGRR